MDDIAQRISEILSDEESMKQLGEIAQMLGLSPDSAPQPEPRSSSGGESAPPDSGGIPDIAAMMSLVSKIKEAGTDDDNISFLNALRPLLSEEKRPKIDRAVKILRLINLLPILKDSGILGGDLLGII